MTLSPENQTTKLESAIVRNEKMTDQEDYLVASFQPSDANILTSTSNTNLLVEFPILASALSQIFPYLLLIDNFLEIVTWTNDDPYQNFLLVVIYSCLVMWWGVLSHIVLPILFAVTFSGMVFSISSVIYDSKFDEKPTIDEVLSTLHNITIRFEMLFRPVKHFRFRVKNILRMLAMTILLTPVHIALLKTVVPPQRFVWLLGIFVLTYHSPWSFATRRLLWRSVYVRVVAFYMTGLNIRITRREFPQQKSQLQSPTVSDSEEIVNDPLLTDFKILRKTNVSTTQVKQVVLFEVLENERRWIGMGWSSLLLHNERPNFCYIDSLLQAPSVEEEFEFPRFDNDLYKYTWEWDDEKWILDHEFNKNKDKDGWIYYDNSWGTGSFRDGFSKYTRARKWTRRAILVIDKRETVYDE